MTLRFVVGIRHRARPRAMFRLPLMRTRRALREFPFISEQVPKEVVAPLRGSGGPYNFQTTGDCIASFSRAKLAFPAKALLFNSGSFGFRTHKCRISGSVGFAKGMPSGYKRYSFFIIHGHTGKGFTNIMGGCNR